MVAVLMTIWLTVIQSKWNIQYSDNHTIDLRMDSLERSQLHHDDYELAKDEMNTY